MMTIGNQSGSGGGGGVASVTGNIVNNADPTNPVVTQQQGDWAETNNANIDYIKNKPNVVLFGTIAPNNSLGIDGDGYMVVDEADNANPLLGNFYKKVAGSWTVVVNFATN